MSNTPLRLTCLQERVADSKEQNRVRAARCSKRGQGGAVCVGAIVTSLTGVFIPGCVVEGSSIDPGGRAGGSGAGQPNCRVSLSARKAMRTTIAATTTKAITINKIVARLRCGVTRSSGGNWMGMPRRGVMRAATSRAESPG